MNSPLTWTDIKVITRTETKVIKPSDVYDLENVGMFLSIYPDYRIVGFHPPQRDEWYINSTGRGRLVVISKNGFNGNEGQPELIVEKYWS